MAINSNFSRPRVEKTEVLTEVTSNSSRSPLSLKNSDMAELILSKLRRERMNDIIEPALNSRVQKSGSSATE